MEPLTPAARSPTAASASPASAGPPAAGRASDEQLVGLLRGGAAEVARLHEKLAARERQLKSVSAEARQRAAQQADERRQYLAERDTWHAEADGLRKELDAARKKAGFREHVAAGGELADLGLSAEELAALQREVREQESLISAYQKENEKLSSELRAARDEQKALRAAHADEIASLRVTMSERASLAILEKEQPGEAQRVLIERANARAAEAEETLAVREAELRFEVDRLRAGKKALEGKLAGVDVQLMAVENGRLREAEEKLATIDEARRLPGSQLGEGRGGTVCVRGRCTGARWASSSRSSRGT